MGDGDYPVQYLDVEVDTGIIMRCDVVISPERKKPKKLVQHTAHNMMNLYSVAWDFHKLLSNRQFLPRDVTALETSADFDTPYHQFQLRRGEANGSGIPLEICMFFTADK